MARKTEKKDRAIATKTVEPERRNLWEEPPGTCGNVSLTPAEGHEVERVEIASDVPVDIEYQIHAGVLYLRVTKARRAQ